jgi:hypothetical protein
MCLRHCVRDEKWQRVMLLVGDLGDFEWVHGLRLGACEMGWVKVVYLENAGKVSKGTSCL